MKPVNLMRWLVRLVTPPGGVVLDCFLGSGSTGVAAVLEGFGFIGLDLEQEYLEIARARIRHAAGLAEPVGPPEPVEVAEEPGPRRKRKPARRPGEVAGEIGPGLVEQPTLFAS